VAEVVSSWGIGVGQLAGAACGFGEWGVGYRKWYWVRYSRGAGLVGMGKGSRGMCLGGCLWTLTCSCR